MSRNLKARVRCWWWWWWWWWWRRNGGECGLSPLGMSNDCAEMYRLHACMHYSIFYVPVFLVLMCYFWFSLRRTVFIWKIILIVYTYLSSTFLWSLIYIIIRFTDENYLFVSSLKWQGEKEEIEWGKGNRPGACNRIITKKENIRTNRLLCWKRENVAAVAFLSFLVSLFSVPWREMFVHHRIPSCNSQSVE